MYLKFCVDQSPFNFISHILCENGRLIFEEMLRTPVKEVINRKNFEIEISLVFPTFDFLEKKKKDTMFNKSTR